MNAGSEVFIGGIKVQMKRHTDKETGVEVPTDIFVAWGRQVEKTTPLSEHELTKFFDEKHIELTESWRAEAEEKARQQEEQTRQQQLLEEQQRQQAEQRNRVEQRRQFEEEMARRRQEEEQQQRQVQAMQQIEEQKRRQEEWQRMQRDTHAKWLNGLQAAGDWTQQSTMGATAAGAAGAAGTVTHDPRVAAALQAASGATANVAAGAGQTRPDQMPAASASGLNPAAAAYPQAAQWNAAQAQQWMQALAYQSQAGWQQQMAARTAAMQQMAGAQMAAAMPTTQQGYEQTLRAQAAYAAHYATLAEQQRGQNAAAYAQAAQGGYLGGQQQQQQNAAAFAHGAAGAYGGSGGGDRM